MCLLVPLLASERRRGHWPLRSPDGLRAGRRGGMAGCSWPPCSPNLAALIQQRASYTHHKPHTATPAHRKDLSHEATLLRGRRRVAHVLGALRGVGGARGGRLGARVLQGCRRGLCGSRLAGAAALHEQLNNTGSKCLRPWQRGCLRRGVEEHESFRLASPGPSSGAGAQVAARAYAPQGRRQCRGSSALRQGAARSCRQRSGHHSVAGHQLWRQAKPRKTLCRTALNWRRRLAACPLSAGLGLPAAHHAVPSAAETRQAPPAQHAQAASARKKQGRSNPAGGRRQQAGSTGGSVGRQLEQERMGCIPFLPAPTSPQPTRLWCPPAASATSCGHHPACSRRAPAANARLTRPPACTGSQSRERKRESSVPAPTSVYR